MRFTVFFIKFMFLAAFFIVSNQNLALADSDNRDLFLKEYTDWIVGVGERIGTLIGYVVKVEWLPELGEPSEQKGEEILKYSQVKR